MCAGRRSNKHDWSTERRNLIRAPSIFKAVRGTEEIGVNNIIRIAAITGVHARLGGCFNEDVGRPRAGEVVDAADIPVHEFHAARAQARKRELAATALKIIEGN